MVNRTFGVVQDVLSLLTFGGLLLQFSGWAVALLAIATLPCLHCRNPVCGGGLSAV
jgi:hypothetical protein